MNIKTDLFRKMPKRSKKNDVAGEKMSVQQTPFPGEQYNATRPKEAKAASASKSRQLADITIFDPIIQSETQETNMLQSEKLPKKSKKNDVAGKSVPPTPFSSEQCNATRPKKAKAASRSKLRQLADITIFDPIIQSETQETDLLQSEKLSKKSKKNDVAGKSVGPSPSSREQCNETHENKAKASSDSKPLNNQQQLEKKRENIFKLNSLVETKGSKYNLLYISMTKDIRNLAKGYECLQSFRTAELGEKSKGNPSCTKGFCIGKVKFVMRKHFNKIPTEDAITPKRFASVISLAADAVFREKLVLDPTAMKTAFETIENPLGKAHGFLVKCIPETEEQKKLFYYYLVTTISMNSLMEINPISCMAIAKWRLDDNNFKRLGLHNKAVDIDETYARCLSDIRATTKYVIKTRNSCFHFQPDDVIDDKVVMKKIMGEFLFLKKNAAKPFTKRFQFCN